MINKKKTTSLIAYLPKEVKKALVKRCKKFGIPQSEYAAKAIEKSLVLDGVLKFDLSTGKYLHQ